MKQIKFMLLAISMLLTTPAFFTSCQEDAPEINYAVTVTVNNDFSKVIEAINNGFLKNEEAIKKLTEAIDNQVGTQDNKYQALLEVLNSINTTLETKLIAIEAAMKAQTLSLETKLALLEAAIKAQTLSLAEKLDLLHNAIEALPDYSDKFDAVVAALNAMKTQVETLGTGQTAIAEKLGEITTAVNNLVAAVNSGNTSAAEALAQIIQKLEELKAAIESGGDSTPDFTGTVTLDGVPMPILRAAIDKSDLDEHNYYDIYLFLSEDEQKYIEIMADGKHHNGKTLDLTQKEDEHDGWYWSVEMRNPQILFQTFAKPGMEYPVFMSGTLLVKRISTSTEFEITLKNGKVKCIGMYGDGLEHTVSLDFKGKLEFDEF